MRWGRRVHAGGDIGHLNPEFLLMIVFFPVSVGAMERYFEGDISFCPGPDTKLQGHRLPGLHCHRGDPFCLEIFGEGDVRLECMRIPGIGDHQMRPGPFIGVQAGPLELHCEFGVCGLEEVIQALDSLLKVTDCRGLQKGNDLIRSSTELLCLRKGFSCGFSQANHVPAGLDKLLVPPGVVEGKQVWRRDISFE